ncbi:MAG: 2'-deoxycytidine 5'-triphosphate deaminase domain-containing protein [Patescibacteria group bacterium]
MSNIKKNKLNHNQGALPDYMLRELIAAGRLTGTQPENVKPASLDLSLSDEIYAVSGIFQLRPGEKIRDLLSLVKAKPIDYRQPLVYDEVYLIRLNEVVDLPDSIYGYCNPKSSTGRNDIHIRVIAEGVPRYDTIPFQQRRVELWALINPKSYSVLLKPGQTLSQLRLFNKDTRLNEEELKIIMSDEGLLWNQANQALSYSDLTMTDGDGSVILTMDLNSRIIGYESLEKNKAVVDFGSLNSVDPQDFFQPIIGPRSDLILRQGHFYLLSSAESVRVPNDLVCEMSPIDERTGEFRSHYAGFIDPGWGTGGTGQGRPLTLEVRPFEDFLVRPQQAIAKINFEKMINLPETGYDNLAGSNYAKQFQVALPKQFKKFQNI